MIKVNAAGKASPEAVAMTRTALAKGAEEIQVSVDSTTAASDVKRLLEDSGFHVQLQDDEGQLSLIGSRGQPDGPAETSPVPVASAASQSRQRPLNFKAAPPPQVPRTGASLKAGPAVLITKKTFGGGDEELGEILIKSLLGSLAKSDVPPAAVALVNEGVKLALFESSTCDHLKDLEARGVRVLVSGTCAAHYGITESIGAGVLSGMPGILSALNDAEKIMTV